MVADLIEKQPIGREVSESNESILEDFLAFDALPKVGGYPMDRIMITNDRIDPDRERTCQICNKVLKTIHYCRIHTKICHQVSQVFCCLFNFYF